MKRFAGPAQADALGGSSASLSEDLLDTLGGPPDEPVKLADGNYLFTACVAHSCTEKGAIVLTPSGSVVAAAMLTNHFTKTVGMQPADAYSRLDFFVRVRASRETAWHRAILKWAKAAYRDNRSVDSKYWSSLGLTESVWLIPKLPGKLKRLSSTQIEPAARVKSEN